MSCVLIVEDNADLRNLYKIAVRNEGYTPLTASDGKEALELLRTQPELPKLIILDLMMPVMNGWQFLEEQAKDAVICGIPVVVCSAIREQAPPNVLFMRKPLDLPKLVQVLNQYCSAKEAEA